jgi:hypothetical protein
LHTELFMRAGEVSGSQARSYHQVPLRVQCERYERLNVEAVAGVMMSTERESSRGLNRDFDEILKRIMNTLSQILRIYDTGRLCRILRAR